MKYKVQVLLSSYNGERYIREQLDSILNQKDIDVSVLIRDDGSEDGTIDILREYEGKYHNVHAIYGENIGTIQSFFELIRKADEEYSFFSFSDQDDVWLSDKLSRACDALKSEENVQRQPLVYCSGKQLVDANLSFLKSAITYCDVRPEFGNALVENMCTGCTCVINQELLQLLKIGQPRFVIMHDFWIYLVGACFGKVIYDPEGRILYRQHGGNELGEASSVFQNYKRRLKNYKKHRGLITKQVSEILRIYGSNMSEENRLLATALVLSKKNMKERSRLLKSRRVFRQRKSDDLIFRCLLRFGKL